MRGVLLLLLLLLFVVDVEALEGKGIRVGVFATVREFFTRGILSGSTFIGGSDRGAIEG